MNLPWLGTMSVMSLLVNIVCLAFAVFWFIKRHTSYSWVGQDILVTLAALFVHYSMLFKSIPFIISLISASALFVNLVSYSPLSIKQEVMSSSFGSLVALCEIFIVILLTGHMFDDHCLASGSVT